MNGFFRLDMIASARADGLRPELRRLLEARSRTGDIVELHPNAAGPVPGGGARQTDAATAPEGRMHGFKMLDRSLCVDKDARRSNIVDFPRQAATFDDQQARALRASSMKGQD